MKIYGLGGIELIEDICKIGFARENVCANYEKLANKVEMGDLIFIKNIGALGRNIKEISERWKFLCVEKNADIVVIDTPILDTRGSANADFCTQIFEVLAENETQRHIRRGKKGSENAKKRGVKLGRSKIKMPDNFAEMVDLWENKRISFGVLLSELGGVSYGTFYRRLREYKQKKSESV